MIQHARRLFLVLGLAATALSTAATPAAAQIPYFQDLMAASQTDRKSTRLNSSHPRLSRMPSSA